MNIFHVVVGRIKWYIYDHFSSVGEANGNPLQYSWEIPWTEKLVGCSPWSHRSQTQLVSKPLPPPFSSGLGTLGSLFLMWSRASQVELVVKSQCRRQEKPGFDPWVGKIPWRRAWQPTPVFLLRESHGQRSLEGYSPWGCREFDTTEVT